MRNFYIELSSNRYTVNGEVTLNWVQCSVQRGVLRHQPVWKQRLFNRLSNPSSARDSVNAWYTAQLACRQNAGTG